MANVKEQWRRALQERSPERTLAGLRGVLHLLQEHPSRFSHLYAPFLFDLFNPRWDSRLTDDDLKTVEAMADALKKLKRPKCSPIIVWGHLVLYYRRVKKIEQARTFLVRIYQEPSLSQGDRRNVVRDLVQLHAIEETYITIYLDYLRDSLRQNAEPAFRAELLKLLASQWAADFHASQQQLRAAYAMATYFVQAGAKAPRSYALFGLYALLVEHLPARAIPHFEEAIRRDSNNELNELAYTGLLVSHLQQRDYQTAIDIARGVPQMEDAFVNGLKNLCRALDWLDVATSSEQSPVTTQSLKVSELNVHVGEVTCITLARLLLIEGDVQQAAQLLHAISPTSPDYARSMYYRAWTALLRGDSQDVAECYKHVKELPIGWTVGCLLLESDPAALNESELSSLLHNTPPAYLPAVQARIALSRSTSFEAGEELVSSGTLEEKMEALRTVLGVTFYRGKRTEMERMMNQPLFSRLSQADQLTWQGLYAILRRDKEQANTLLDKAVRHYRYPRAALLLAAYLLEQDPGHDMTDLLDIATARRAHAKVELCQQQYQEMIGRIEQLEQLPSSDDPRQQYKLGKAYFAHAELAYRQGEREKSVSSFQNAATLLSSAVHSGMSLPPDCHVLARWSALLVEPELAVTAYVELWHEVEQLVADEQPGLRWLFWYALLEHIQSAAPAQVAVVCEELQPFLEQAQNIDKIVIAMIAQAIVHACHRAERASQAKKMLDLLKYLSDRHANSMTKHLYRLCTTINARLQYVQSRAGTREQVYQSLKQQAMTDPGNGSLAMLLAFITLSCAQQDTAVQLLRASQPEDEYERRLCTSLAILLTSDEQASLPELPLPAEIDAAPLVQVHDLLLAITAAPSESSSEALISALDGPLTVIAPIIDIRRCFDALCSALLSRKKADARIVTLVQNVAHFLQDNTPLVVMVRCLLMIGAIDLALCLWKQMPNEVSNMDSTLGQDVATVLCYLAVQAHNANDARKMAQLLRQAANFLQQDVQNTQSQGRVRGFSAPDLEQLAHQTELQAAAYSLVTVCIVDGEHNCPPGRYHFLTQRIEQWPSLLDALLSNDASLAHKNWEAALASPMLTSDIRFQHGLTILHYESVLESALQQGVDSRAWQLNTARWILLLSTTEFWSYFAQTHVAPDSETSSPLSEQQQDELMHRAVHRILSLHCSLAREAFTSAHYAEAAEHLRSLVLCRKGTGTLMQFLRTHESNYSFRPDEQRMSEVQKCADQLLESWYDTPLQEAEQRLSDARIIEQLVSGIRKNYEGAINHLHNLLNLNIANKRVLLTCLTWYNEWCNDVAGLTIIDDKLLVFLVQAASTVADDLIPFCESKLAFAYRPENQQLGRHFLYRALICTDMKKAMKFLNGAQAWGETQDRVQTWRNVAQELRALASAMQQQVLPYPSWQQEATKDRKRAVCRQQGLDPRIVDIACRAAAGQGQWEASLWVCNSMLSPQYARRPEPPKPPLPRLVQLQKLEETPKSMRRRERLRQKQEEVQDSSSTQLSIRSEELRLAIQHMLRNPFQVLGLPTTATNADIVERRRELDMGAEPQAQLQYRRATEELTTHPLTRLEHALFEVPGTRYENPLLERFCRVFKRNSVRQVIDAAPLTLDDVHFSALVQQLLDGLLTLPEAGLRETISRQSSALRPDLPLGVRDVIF